MDLRSCHPFWLIKNGLPAAYPKLDRSQRCDVLVVGAGITGAIAAYHLQEAGLSTIVLDKREVAWGSTAASTALLQYEIDTPLVELTQKLGWNHASSAYLACRDAIGKLHRLTSRLDQDCGFSLRPSLYLAKRKQDLPFFKQELAARRRAGINVEFLSSRELKATMGLKKSGALWSKNGGQVDAFALAHALLKSASHKGLRVYDRTELSHYEWQEKGLIARTTDGHSIEAKQVVFATGYEAQSMLPKKLVSLHSTFALVSEPLPANQKLWKKGCLIWEHDDPYLYLRNTPDRRVIVGGEDEPYRDPERRDAALAGKIKTLERKLKRLFPHLKCETAFAWAGTFGSTKDGLAYIGRVPEFPRAWFSLGFGGNGITYSILAAEIVRDGILGKKNRYATLFGFDR